MEEKVISYVQQTIMNEWRNVMRYEGEMRETGEDDITKDCIANAKERIEIYTIILNKLEQ